jgi:hypothetical protein
MTKTDSELVDDFIEGLASGTVVSTLLKTRGSYTDKGFETIGQCTKAIEDYRFAVDPMEKEVKAKEALTQILHNRVMGVYVNDPSQERMNLLKTENDALRRENAELGEQLARTMDTVRRLQAEIAGKGGIR